MNRSYPALAVKVLLLLAASPAVAQTPDASPACMPGPDFFKGLFFGIILGFTVSWLFFRRSSSGRSPEPTAVDSAENPPAIADSMPETEIAQDSDATPEANSEPLPDSLSDAADLVFGSTSDSLPSVASENVLSAVEAPAIPDFVSDPAKRDKCEKWLIALGGSRNVVSAATCAMTRIRIVLRDAGDINFKDLITAEVKAVMAPAIGILHLIIGFDAPEYETELQQLLNSSRSA